MKKRIIFVTNSMVLGGIEKSLLDLIYLLPKDQFEITLLLDQKKGRLPAVCSGKCQDLSAEIF